MKRAAIAALAVALAGPAAAAEYGLQPVQVAPDSYVVEGARAYFSRANGGNIVNVAFIATPAGVVVIDTGPSALYGRELRAAIARIAPGPIVRVLNTHLHPDHFLGNQAFADADVVADAATLALIQRQGQDLAANLYRLSGDWMRGTEPVTPAPLVPDGETIGGHRLRYLRLAGHSDSDLAVFDETTGVLFASDLVFHDRAATTPHADIERWLAALDELERLPFKVLVPGHGPVATSAAPIRQTRDYLLWLRQTFQDAAANGLDMAEVLALPIPERFAGLALLREEFARSIAHHYPKFELARLPASVRPK